MSDELEFIIRRKMLEIERKRLSALYEENCGKGVKHVNSASFESILKKCKVVLADFWAEWCGPCRMIEPIIEEIASRYTPKMAVVKVNVDANPDLAQSFEVMSIPTVILFRRGREHRRFIGFYPGMMSQLEREIKALLA